MENCRTDDPNYHDPDHVDGKPVLTTCFPRYCSQCGTGMEDGWMYDNGEQYLCSPKCIVDSKVFSFLQTTHDLDIYWATEDYYQIEDPDLIYTTWDDQPHGDWHCDCNN